MKRFIAILFCLAFLMVHMATESIAEHDSLSDLSVILPADELLLADFGSNDELLLKMTNVQLQTLHPESMEAEEGYAYLLLDFDLANYSFDEIGLKEHLTAYLLYDKSLRYDAELTVQDETLGMLEESAGRFTFCLPGAVAADAERVVLHLIISGAEYLALIDVAEQAMALGFAPAAADVGPALILQNVKPMLALSWNGEQEAAYRYLVLECELFNNTADTLETAASVSATLNYQLLYQYTAQLETAREMIAPMETQTIRLVFRLPYIVATSEDDETSLMVLLNGQLQETAFRMSDATPPDHSYRVFYDSMDWETAKATCEAMGGHLVTITSAEENTFVTSLFVEGEKLWYGGYADTNRLWHWVTGEEFSYTNWYTGQPDNYKSQEYGLESYTDQMWNDGNQTSTGVNGYICEWDDARQCNYPDVVNWNPDAVGLSEKPVFTSEEVIHSHGLLLKGIDTWLYQADPENDKYQDLVIELAAINCSQATETLKSRLDSSLVFRDKYVFDPVIVYSHDMLEPLDIAKVRLIYHLPVMVIKAKSEEIRLSVRQDDQEIGIPFSLSDAAGAKMHYSIGTVVTLGVYEQDGNESNGMEPIQWRIIAGEGAYRLLISEYGLETRSFNTEKKKVTWSDCTLRKWLNQEFYNAAFAPEEQTYIRQSVVKTPANPTTRVAGCDDTNDYVFILSIQEAEQFMPEQSTRIAKATPYVDQKTHWNRWTLRTPGYDYLGITYVRSAGAIGMDTRGESFVSDATYMIRPALWINVDGLVSLLK